jgi:iron complex outermembrane recepter protein
MNIYRKSVLFAATALSAAYGAPAFAQSTDQADEAGSSNDIVVTARRVEERLQDVPISVTVLSEKTLANNNIQSAKDIATYTPSLVTNNRFGSDNTTWTIRGFTQEQRTTSTVGTYFADVVAPRGSGATQGGDGAGPGALFDLANIQVLNGPQGTLFGRNSTGGAVLLVPKKPTDNLEGYVEGSAGQYNMWRLQGVINAPLSDTVRVRLGIDRNKRDGYLTNAGIIPFGPFGDKGGSVDYWAFRGSVVWDVTPDIENYTIGTYSHSKSTGVTPKVIRCYSVALCAQKAREDAIDPWAVSNTVPDSQSVSKQWQVINTTTWKASDTLTVKNLFSYGEFRGITNLDLFGFYQTIPGVTLGTETSISQVRPFVFTHALPGGYTNAESSMVEELQLQGGSEDGRFNWQGGLYLEVNKPLGASGVQTATFTPCVDSSTLNCTPFAGLGGTSLGRLNYQATSTTFNGKAAYAQASYAITDKLKLTGGLRYTQDTMQAIFQTVDVRLGNTIVASAAAPKIYNGTTLTTNTVIDYVACGNTVAFGAQGSATNPYLPLSEKNNICLQGPGVAGKANVPKVKSTAPTWLLGLDYKPQDNVLIYAKWARGYRQGGVAPFAADTLQTYGPEKVDTYELGAKTSWRGAVPGYFNISGYYNDFRNQQLQVGLSCNPVALCAQTTTILNAGKSRLSGYEAELGASFFEGFNASLSYAHLSTKVLAISDVTPIIASKGLPFNDIRPIPVGSVLPNSIPDKIVGNASYTLPLPSSIGKITFGGTFVYQSAYRVVSDSTATAVTFTPAGSLTPVTLSTVGNGILPSATYANVNVNWENVGGMPVDAAFFITNVTNKQYLLHANLQETNGATTSIVSEPRMWGFRLKYRFGN